MRGVSNIGLGLHYTLECGSHQPMLECVHIFYASYQRVFCLFYIHVRKYRTFEALTFENVATPSTWFPFSLTYSMHFKFFCYFVCLNFVIFNDNTPNFYVHNTLNYGPLSSGLRTFFDGLGHTKCTNAVCSMIPNTLFATMFCNIIFQFLYILTDTDTLLVIITHHNSRYWCYFKTRDSRMCYVYI